MRRLDPTQRHARATRAEIGEDARVMPAGPPGRRLRAREMPTPHAGILGDRDAIPSPTGQRPPLGPVEAFILSKADGRRTIGDIGALASLSVLEVAVLIARLEELGAVTLKRGTAELQEDDVVELEDWPTVDGVEPGSRGE